MVKILYAPVPKFLFIHKANISLPFLYFCTGAMLPEWERVGVTKARIKQMQSMIKQEVGFNDVETFLQHLEDRTHLRRGQGKLERKILHLAMKKKVNDEKGRLRRDKWDKDRLRDSVRDMHGRQSTRYKKQMRYLHRETKTKINDLETRYVQKIEHLKIKHKTEDRKVPLSRRMRQLDARQDRRYGHEYPGLHIYQTEEYNMRLEERLDNASEEELARVIMTVDLIFFTLTGVL